VRRAVQGSVHTHKLPKKRKKKLKTLCEKVLLRSRQAALAQHQAFLGTINFHNWTTPDYSSAAKPMECQA
jgi:hypothetical protein